MDKQKPRKQVGVICTYCGAKVLKDFSEWSRNQRLKRNNFCSISCACSYRLKTYKNPRSSDANKYLKTKVHDELSPFRYHLRNIKAHCKKINERHNNQTREVEIDLIDLKQQWDKQDGICPYTGWKMVNAIGTGKNPSLTPDRASVDRIDSSKGYTKDNIQFISYMAQTAKNKFHEDELIKFCQDVVNYKNSKKAA